MSLKVSGDGQKSYVRKEGAAVPFEDFTATITVACSRSRMENLWTEFTTQGDSHRDEENRHGNPDHERIRQSFAAGCEVANGKQWRQHQHHNHQGPQAVFHGWASQPS